jgi:hypothetical protein
VAAVTTGTDIEPESISITKEKGAVQKVLNSPFFYVPDYSIHGFAGEPKYAFAKRSRDKYAEFTMV